ncbi:unnamed protein product [Allacma fusca]|uniref:Peptidase S1 domain-containing protein n=1 Tax=Allacma fusca TaxID=39272 RepID=A0A8J2KCI9_9HEXA|nr:unnamed protein product [Allacma fusca]
MKSRPMLSLRKYLCLVFMVLTYMNDIPHCTGTSVLGHNEKSRLVRTNRLGRIRGGGGISSEAAPLNCDCKRRHQRVPPRDARIWNGTAAVGNDFPWQVRIEQFNRHGTNTWDHICGGTLISSRHVLTASHCLDKDADRYQVLVGTHSRHNKGRKFRVRDYVQHRETHYEYENDIALMTIEDDQGRGVTCDQHVQPICLDGPEFKDGTYCFVSGWGSTETRNLSDRLLYASVPLLPFKTCQNVFDGRLPPNYVEPSSNYLRSMYSMNLRTRFTNKMICAGPLGGGSDVCSGDSGGPLACFDNNSVAYLTGITSWAASLCGSQPSAYTKVSEYKNWIRTEQGLSSSAANSYTMRGFYR